MITHLSLKDFKAFHTLSLNLRPVTVLVGENNSGKSSVIAALRLLAQTESSFDPRVPLLLQGELGDFGTYRDLVHGNHRGRPFRIGITAEQTYGDEHVRYDLSVEFKYRTVRRELILKEVRLTEGTRKRHLITVTYSTDAGRHLVTRFGGQPVRASARARVSDGLRMYHFLPQIGFARRTRRTPAERFRGILSAETASQVSSDIEEASFFLREEFRNIDYIGAMRMPPERTYAQTGEARTRIGPAGENWINVLVRELAIAGRTRSGLPQTLREWLHDAGLASDLAARWASDRHFEVELRHPTSGEWENLADVGQANSQVLPVLVGGLRLEEEAMYLVEEPEIHLHPRAQAELGDFFLLLFDAGVSSIVETHSEYLLLRLQQHVAEGNLPAEDVLFYYVSATQTGKQVNALTLDSQGRFKEPIPGGFFPERLEEAKKLARLRGRNLISGRSS